MVLEDYSKYFMYGGIALSIAAIAFFYFLYKKDGTDLGELKVYLLSNRWQGDVLDSKIESWQQTNAKYGNDFFYDISFYLNGETKLYTAKALIQPSQMHMIKKGLNIKIKKGGKGKLAVVGIEFN